MEKYKAPLSIRIIHVITEIIFWLLAFVTFAALLFSVVTWCGGFKNDMQFHVNLPVEFSSNETGLLLRSHSVVRVQLVELTGSLHLIDTPHDISSIFCGAVVFVVGFFFFMIYTFRKFMRNVKEGDIFTLDNTRQLQIISIALFIFWIFSKLYAYLMWLLIARRLEFGTIEFSSNQRSFLALLFISLFLWTLSHILKKGVQLQEESRLTI